VPHGTHPPDALAPHQLAVRVFFATLTPMWLTSVLRFLRRLQKPPTIHPAMPWSFRRDFHIDLSASYGSYLLESNLRPVALQTPPDLVAGDKLPVRIYLWERDATSGDPVAVVTPEGTSMVFAGRPANAPLDSSLLFLSSNLAESETEPGVWEGTLDLNTVELHNHLASQTTGEITILGEIELRSSDATPNRQSIQFDLNARRQVYAGVEGEAAALATARKILTDIPISAEPSRGSISFHYDNSITGQGITVNGTFYKLVKTNPNAEAREWGSYPGFDLELMALLKADGLVFVYSNGSSMGIFDFDIAAQEAGVAGNSIALSSTLNSAVVVQPTGGVDAVPQADFSGQIGIFQMTPDPGMAAIYIATKAGQTYWHTLRGD
jgi:hypothetical protein